MNRSKPNENALRCVTSYLGGKKMNSIPNE
jgi:hypothetical protein